jgi:uncharacterized membrane protein
VFGFTYRRTRRLIAWAIPLSYALIALLMSLGSPILAAIIENPFEIGFSTTITIEFLSSLASGMLALTAIIFSILFISVQFGSQAYSPRLVGMFTRDRVILHTLGIFIGTYIFALSSLVFTDLVTDSESIWMTVTLAFLFLIISTVMFVTLIQRLAQFQINNVLSTVSKYGLKAIEITYHHRKFGSRAVYSGTIKDLHVTQTMTYQGDTATVLDIDIPALSRIAQRVDGVIVVRYAIGDHVQNGVILLRIHGARRRVSTIALRRSFKLGTERQPEFDPRYAMRLLVDIAIKALSPAVNDPTTAVQAINHIEGLLLALGNVDLNTNHIFDASGNLRVVIPVSDWDDYLSLAFEEIHTFGKNSVQVMRRLLALIDDLEENVPRERLVALHIMQERLRQGIEETFTNPQDRAEALAVDRQGLGLGRIADQ